MGVRIASYNLKILVIVNGLGLSTREKNPATIPYSLTSEIRSKHMRNEILKIKRAQSTKAERRFMEVLKKYHMPFRYKVRIAGREIDFVIGNLAIEIDGHPQDVSKNYMLIEHGYNPIHFNNWEIPNPNLVKWLQDNGRFFTLRPTSDNCES